VGQSEIAVADALQKNPNPAGASIVRNKLILSLAYCRFLQVLRFDA
jgi:hypothetical protein